jgi:hypothetical protein
MISYIPGQPNIVNVKRLNPDLAHFLKNFWGILVMFSSLSPSLHLVMRQFSQLRTVYVVSSPMDKAAN